MIRKAAVLLAICAGTDVQAQDSGMWVHVGAQHVQIIQDYTFAFGLH